MVGARDARPSEATPVVGTLPAAERLLVRTGVVEGPDGSSMRIDEQPLVIGRSSRCGLAVDDPLVSFQHALMQATEGGIRLRDLRSRNGTFVGSIRIIDEVYLTESCMIRVGDSWLRLVLGELEPKNHPPAKRFGGMVGASPAMRDVFAQLERWAAKDYPILICGETGTGKDRLAKAVHKASDRSGGPFVAVNCQEFPKHLVESGLFGHVRGAFTGAEGAHPGVFAEAEGGTLFVDEIGEMSLELQTKLLRVLQNKEMRPVGGTARSIDVRTIFATNRDLDQARADGTFREDLYHRIAQVRVDLPPLRERLEDLPLLIDDICAELGRPPVLVEPSALERIRQLPWRGNIRELRSTLFKAFDICPGPILSLASLEPVLPPAEPLHRADPGSYDVAKAAFEREFFRRKLEQHRGNLSQMARDIGRDRAALRDALRRFGLWPRSAS